MRTSFCWLQGPLPLRRRIGRQALEAVKRGGAATTMPLPNRPPASQDQQALSTLGPVACCSTPAPSNTDSAGGVSLVVPCPVGRGAGQLGLGDNVTAAVPIGPSTSLEYQIAQRQPGQWMGRPDWRDRSRLQTSDHSIDSIRPPTPPCRRTTSLDDRPLSRIKHPTSFTTPPAPISHPSNRSDTLSTNPAGCYNDPQPFRPLLTQLHPRTSTARGHPFSPRPPRLSPTKPPNAIPQSTRVRSSQLRSHLLTDDNLVAAAVLRGRE